MRKVVSGSGDRRSLRWTWRRIERWVLLVATAVALLLLGLKARSILIAAAWTLGQLSWLGVLAVPAFCLWTLAASKAWQPLIVGSGVRSAPALGRLWLIRLEL